MSGKNRPARTVWTARLGRTNLPRTFGEKLHTASAGGYDQRHENHLETAREIWPVDEPE
jgi:hypothetical protein